MAKDDTLINVAEDANALLSTPDVPGDKKKDKKPQKKEPTITLYAKVKENPVRSIRNLISITETHMQERVMAWDRYRRKYRRGLYYLRTMQNGVPLYFTNYIYSTIESVKANLTRNLPLLTASPRGQRDDLAADLVSRVLQDSLERTGLKHTTREIVHHALLATMAYYKVSYSELKDAVEIEAVAPDDLLVDPKATTLNDARYIIHKKSNVPVDEIYADYGAIPSEKNEESDRSNDMESDTDGLYVTEGELQAAIDVAPTYDVYEAWIRCWEADRDNDWYIVVIAGNTVLREEFSVYEHKRHPFVAWFAGEDFSADNIYHRGVGYVEEIEPLQDRVDALDLKIYKHISLMANRQRYIAAQSGLAVETMDNTAGRTYKVNGDPTKAVYYDAPPQMAQEAYNYRDRTEVLMQNVSGVMDVTMGRRPTGITAGRAIDSLKESAETRVAALLDTLAESIADVGNLALQIIFQFYDGERIIRSTDGDKDKDFVVLAEYPDELQPTPMPLTDAMGNTALDEEGMPMIDPDSVDENGEGVVSEQLLSMRDQFKKDSGIALVLSDVTYTWDIKANTDSALPSARAERGQIASDLFRLGAIDREALLEAMDWPQRHKILQRLAADATGQNAGDPNVDTTGNQVQMLVQMLTQLGIDPQQAQQMVDQVFAQSSQQASGNGTFPPQMV